MMAIGQLQNTRGIRGDPFGFLGASCENSTFFASSWLSHPDLVSRGKSRPPEKKSTPRVKVDRPTFARHSPDKSRPPDVRPTFARHLPEWPGPARLVPDPGDSRPGFGSRGPGIEPRWGYWKHIYHVSRWKIPQKVIFPHFGKIFTMFHVENCPRKSSWRIY